jgi:hypothetical protein
MMMRIRAVSDSTTCTTNAAATGPWRLVALPDNAFAIRHDSGHWLLQFVLADCPSHDGYRIKIFPNSWTRRGRPRHISRLLDVVGDLNARKVAPRGMVGMAAWPSSADGAPIALPHGAVILNCADDDPLRCKKRGGQ